MDSAALGVGLEPFGISPDPRFIHFDPELGRDHQVLLNGLRCGIGVAVVTGERGVGKTTLLHCLAAELDFADHLVVSVSCLGRPSLGDIMAAFGFRIGFPGQPKADRGEKSQTSLSDMLGFIGVCGATAILLLDDADSLSAETLAGLLSMSNKGSEDSATVSIVLAGSSDLARRLERISGSSSVNKPDLVVPLSPLKPEDVESYISHRLRVSGHGKVPVFEPAAIDRIAYYARGNPQAINRICRAAMVIAAGQSRKTVSARMVEQVTWSARGGPTPVMTGVMAGTGSLDDETIGAAAGTHGTDAADSAADLGPMDSATEPAGEEPVPPDPQAEDRPPLQVLDIQRARPRPPSGHRRWVGLGALSAAAAVVLYLAAGGGTPEKMPLAADHASGTNTVDVAAPVIASTDDEFSAELNDELGAELDAVSNDQYGAGDPSQTAFVATSLSAEGEPFRSGTDSARPYGDRSHEYLQTIPSDALGSTLEQAVYLGDVDAVNAFLDAGADIDAPVLDGLTLLMVAAATGDKAMVMSLIERGADVSLGRVDGSADLAGGEASEFETGAGSAFSMPVDPGMPADMGRAAPGEFSREAPNAELHGKLWREGGPMPVEPDHVPLNLVPPPGTPAYAMAESPAGPADRDTATAEAANQVARHGTNKPQSANPQSAKSGMTPLIAAATAGHADVVDVLLAAGADVNAADARGRTPLIVAVGAGDRVSAGLILARGAHVGAVDDAGRSASDIARENGRYDLVELISSRARPLMADAQSSPVETNALPLSSASRHMPPDVDGTGAEQTAAVIQRQPEPGRVQQRSASASVQYRARVIQTQRYLRQLGYDPGPVDGVRGAKTRAAVRAFQRDRGLKPDGRITSDLMMSLASKAGAHGTSHAAAKPMVPPAKKNVFHSMLSGLQSLRGLDFNSKTNPEEIYAYCEKSRDNWIYDEGAGETIYCNNFLRSKKL